MVATGGVGVATVTTTSSTYVDSSLQGGTTSLVNLDTTQYYGATYYFEATFFTSAATGYVSLFDSSDVEVSGAGVTTTSTSAVRVRSGAITPSSGDYKWRFKNDGTNTTTIYNARIVIIQNANKITNTESQIPLETSIHLSTSSSSYVDIGSSEWGFFLYTSSEWDGTLNFYYESNLRTDSGIGYSILYDDTASATVSGSEVSTSSTSFVRVRSGSFSLTNSHVYKPRSKGDGSSTVTLIDARLIAQQSNNPTKSVSYLTLNSQASAFATTGSYLDTLQIVNYTSANWNVDSITWEHEAHWIINNSSTTNMDIYKLTDAAQLSGSELSGTDLNVNTRYRSGSITMPSSQDLTSRAKLSAVGTIATGPTRLIATMTWTNTSQTVDKMFLLFQ